MRLDVMQWNQERLELEQKIRALKNSIKNGGVREDSVWNNELRKHEMKPVTFSSGMGTCRDYENLYALQTRATVLYKIRAYTHGRQHLKGMDKADADTEAKELLGMNLNLVVQEPLAAVA